ncbi:hypothetical protein [Archangium lipolyticum]|uniref:hypothetical protein n=1 Tax=Archangium lipolyticum TaxID=2970465 RepID=UPI00214A44F0|nr:hypothetical protein [Archangium lipolyticum]
MKRLVLSAAATALLLSPLACDLGKTGNQILAENVMVGTLFSTPDVNVSAAAMAGYDAGTLPDGGIPEGERITIPGQTAALVFFGTRNGEQGTPQPLANATVRLEPQNGSPLTLDNKGAGTYGQTSDVLGDGGIKYQSGATYRFVATQGGNSYVGVVEEAPALERIARLHPPEGFISHTANQGLTLQRPPVAGNQARTLGFVTVVPLGDNGEKGQPTYTNVPKEPLDFLEIVLAPVEWQKESIVIPGSAFPNPESNYLVVFQTVKTGGPESENLFVGSALLVGTADLGMVHTK